MSELLTSSFHFADPQDLADLRTFVTRAKNVDDGAIRLQGSGSVLAAYVCVLRPRLLGESTPTILGLRTMALSRPSTVDVTVPLSAVLDRIARASENSASLPVPPSTVSESWTGVSAPRSGWDPVGPVSEIDLRSVAEAGIREVADLVPSSAGAMMVNNARANVWGRPVDFAAGLPAGAAFAALTLGFLADGKQELFRAGRWFRLSGPRGHVLIRTGTNIGLPR